MGSSQDVALFVLERYFNQYRGRDPFANLPKIHFYPVHLEGYLYSFNVQANVVLDSLNDSFS